MVIWFGEEWLTRHERHIDRQCCLEQCASIQRLFERQLEKQATLRHMPIRQVGKYDVLPYRSNLILRVFDVTCAVIALLLCQRLKFQSLW
jgi:hypothetical protein